MTELAVEGISSFEGQFVAYFSDKKDTGKMFQSVIQTRKICEKLIS